MIPVVLTQPRIPQVASLVIAAEELSSFNSSFVMIPEHFRSRVDSYIDLDTTYGKAKPRAAQKLLWIVENRI